MLQVQILNKIIQSHSMDIVEEGGLTREDFGGYENEFDFIVNHYKEYGNVPDLTTVLNKFEDFDVIDVQESDKFLIDSVYEIRRYQSLAKELQQSAVLLQDDAFAASEYLMSVLNNFQYTKGNQFVDIIHDAGKRFDRYKEVKEKQEEWFIPSGFQELDELTHGFQRGEELVVLFARVNQGKSWVLSKMCEHVFRIGFNVGYVSPEMSADSIGYRFDTLFKNFSNRGLMWGNDSVKDEEYETYIRELGEQYKNKFLVATPLDFGNQITISKLRNFVKQNKLDFLAIDGIKYLSDERGRARDNITISLTNISEDLMSLSMELKIPIVTVVQANRGAVDKDSRDSLPELESIRDSDGISHNASKVLSIRQTKDGKLEIGVKKQRFGPVGGKVSYYWDIDKGDFTFVPQEDLDNPKQEEKHRDRPRQKVGVDIF